MGGRGAFSQSAISGGRDWRSGNVGEDGKPISEDNFMNYTAANFSPVGRPSGEPDYKSRSGSEYWYVNGGVVRGSDHWGSNIASCDWYLDKGDYSGYEKRYGFANFSAFTLKPEMLAELSNSDQAKRIVNAIEEKHGKDWKSVLANLGETEYQKEYTAAKATIGPHPQEKLEKLEKLFASRVKGFMPERRIEELKSQAWWR